jgi:hypothetical protein
VFRVGREGLDLVGIVTLTDIVWQLPALREEAGGLRAVRSEWAPS